MNTDKTKLIIVGSKGRMGEALARLAGQDPNLEVVALVDKGDNVLDSIDRCDVLIEFAHHSLSGDLAKTAADRGKAMVIGTTGHTADERQAIETTARHLGEILAEASGGTYDALALHGRHGDVGARPRRVIGMHALRGGDVVGDHTVHFSTLGERLELTHRASSRDTFASGALRAAQWVRTQKPGLYSMQDVLGLKR